ncbi:transmembrane protein 241-like [Physella acuta]|uniref:transmembrane protein 241-like n=1 Tax=Physella acuta TaxID=109671 RepID=UPI0027DE4EDE|nr:transmembrane protein 241-like [Physella acuta]
MKRNVLFTSFFCLLFISTTFLNKYILSVLKFTYPTIFQGWQTLVGIIMFKALFSTGYVDGLLNGKDWRDWALWLPGMMCFLISIYSGSRALSSLPIPVYLVMQNLVLAFKATVDLIHQKQVTTLYSYCMLMLSLLSALCVVKTDPQYDSDGYLWMCVHIASLGAFETYTYFIKRRLKLRAMERLYCCCVYSVIVLTPASYFLGDAFDALKFPFFYFAKFYIGCLFSGILGMLLNLCAIRLHEMEKPFSDLDVNTMYSIAKIFCSIASLGYYEMKHSYSFTFFISINLICSFGYCESVCHKHQQKNFSPAFPSSVRAMDTKSGVDLSQYLKRHELQQDMIHIDIV